MQTSDGKCLIFGSCRVTRLKDACWRYSIISIDSSREGTKKEPQHIAWAVRKQV